MLSAPAVIRLQSFDACAQRTRDTRQVAVLTMTKPRHGGFLVRPSRLVERDRELGRIAGSGANRRGGEAPCEVVQGGPQVVGYVPGDDPEFERYWLFGGKGASDKFEPGRVLIHLRDDVVGVSLDERAGLSVQFVQMYERTGNLGIGLVQRVGHDV